MKIEKIDHVHVYVKDMKKAVAFFEAVLGSPFSEVRHNPEVQLNWRMSQTGIELLSSTSSNGIVAKFIEHKGEGLAGISLKVADIEEAVSELESYGMRVVGKYEHGVLREVQFHPKDFFGVAVELCEYNVNHDSFIANG